MKTQKRAAQTTRAGPTAAASPTAAGGDPAWLGAALNARALQKGDTAMAQAKVDPGGNERAAKAAHAGATHRARAQSAPGLQSRSTADVLRRSP